MQEVALIDYGSGNVHSAQRALEVAADMAGVRCRIELTGEPERVARADRVVLPGVGHFADCMAALRARAGLIEAMERAVLKREVPFLGICVGMQLMADFGAEDGNTRGLGWIHGAVLPIDPGPGLAVPHMGWNALEIRVQHPLLANLGDDPHAYFVHSYAFSPEDETQIVAAATYGRPLTAAIARANLFGTQFHPEKSQQVGLRLLASFLRWDPT